MSPQLYNAQQLLEISPIHGWYFTEMLPWQRVFSRGLRHLDRQMQEKMKGKVQRETYSSSLFLRNSLKHVERFCFSTRASHLNSVDLAVFRYSQRMGLDDLQGVIFLNFLILCRMIKKAPD